MNQNTRNGFREAGRKTRDMVTGMLSGLMLFAVIILYLTAGIAEARPETYLAAQDITLSGRVTAPSCTVRLENSQLKFSAIKNEIGTKDDKNKEVGTAQTLRLNVSECDADGIGILFKSDHWPNMPVRGVLRSVTGRNASDEWYYTISPGEKDDASWPLLLAKDSEVPEAETRQVSNTDNQYYKLSDANYWYDLKKPLRDGGELVIPFLIKVYHDQLPESKATDSDMEGTFTVQLSWR